MIKAEKYSDKRRAGLVESESGAVYHVFAILLSRRRSYGIHTVYYTLAIGR